MSCLPPTPKHPPVSLHDGETKRNRLLIARGVEIYPEVLYPPSLAGDFAFGQGHTTCKSFTARRIFEVPSRLHFAQTSTLLRILESVKAPRGAQPTYGQAVALKVPEARPTRCPAERGTRARRAKNASGA